MESIFTPLLSPRLKSHLHSIPLQPLSRILAPRLTTRAIPHIGTIELVASTDFATIYDSLYIASFPKRLERERSDLIVARLADQDADRRPGHAPYRVIGIRDANGEAIGAAHISVLPLQGSAGSGYAVPYLQYLYVRPQNRRQDMSEVLHTIVLGVAEADAAAMGGRSVPFTFFETEPPGHGDDEATRLFSHSRALIHANTGGMALVLVPQGSTTTIDPSNYASAHVQPGLEPEDPPLTLVWVVRPSPTPGKPYEIASIGKELTAAYYQSLRNEGFPEANIAKAERMVAERWVGREAILVPLSGVRTFYN